MKRFRAKAAFAAAVAFGFRASLAPAVAAPPTVTPSPGYDARLRESRTAPTVSTPVAPAPDLKPMPPRKAKRTNVH